MRQSSAQAPIPISYGALSSTVLRQTLESYALHCDVPPTVLKICS